MDSAKIFIDTDNEITFILEKILSAKSERVALVIPDRASIFSSITSLKLIKRVVDKSNKLLVLVTLDQQGSQLSQDAGLFVVSRVGEINEGIWERALKAKFEVIKKKSKSHYLPAETEKNTSAIEGLSEVKAISTPVESAVSTGGMISLTELLMGSDRNISAQEEVVPEEKEIEPNRLQEIPEIRISVNVDERSDEIESVFISDHNDEESIHEPELTKEIPFIPLELEMDEEDKVHNIKIHKDIVDEAVIIDKVEAQEAELESVKDFAFIQKESDIKEKHTELAKEYDNQMVDQFGKEEEPARKTNIFSGNSILSFTVGKDINEEKKK